MSASARSARSCGAMTCRSRWAMDFVQDPLRMPMIAAQFAELETLGELTKIA